MTWFIKQPPYSISNFTDLSTKFLTQFSANQAQKATPADMFNIRQHSGERIKTYMSRFSRVSVQLEDASPDVCVAAFKNGLRCGSLNKDLTRRSAKDMMDLRARVQEFILVEQDEQTKKDRDDWRAHPDVSSEKGRAPKDQRPAQTPRQPRPAPYPAGRHGPQRDNAQLDAVKNKGGDSAKGKEVVEELGVPAGSCLSIAGGFGGGRISSKGRKRFVEAVNSVHHAYEGECWLNHTPITFSPKDFDHVIPHDNDPIVVTLRVNNYVTKKVFLDQGSSADIIYGDAFERLGLKESDLKPYMGCLVGFTGDRAKVRGYVELDTAFGEGEYVKEFQVKYLVLPCKATYNVLLGRDTLNKICAIISTAHLTVKYPACNGKVGILRVDQEAARACYAQSLELYGKKAAKEAHRVTEIFPHENFNLDPRDDSEELRPQPAGETKSVHLSGRALKIGSTLSKEQEDRLVELLKNNLNLFAWTIKDVPGIDPSVISHHLSIQPGAKPVVQARRRMGEEKDKAVQIETQKLLDGKFIREVQYPTWLANVVMVRKANGKWRMCTDYTSLNKVCPKDSYPLPNVDKLVDGASGNELLSLMDAYSGYNQIMMYRPDEEKTAFMTRRNMEVYVDDMIVKTVKGGAHHEDLAEAFAQIRKYNMRLNPEKCSFGILGGKFLGFMVTSSGIEVNPDKCKAIVNMKSPSNIREVQRLTGRLAALSRFLPKAGDRAVPFFACLKKNTTFQWTGACEEAFQQLKELLASPPMLAKPTPGIPLILYLAVTEAAVSTVLLQEENKQYKIIYFVSHTLQGAEARYQKIEKPILKTVRRLRPYFQSFQIKVKTDIPLRQVLQKPDLSGRLVSWSIELSEYDISYEPRGQVTIQSLIDFVAELTPTESDKENAEWVLSVDGSSNESGSGAGVSIESPDKMLIEQSLKFGFKASNNQSEYEALIAGLRLAIELGVPKLYIKGDSQLVVKQVRGEYQVKDPQLSKYLEIVQRLMQAIGHVRIEHIPRSQNERADALAKLASTGRLGNYQTVIQEVLPHPSTDMVEFKVAKAIGNGEPSWTDPIIEFLSQQPQDESKNTKERRREASFYTLVGGQLYRRGIMSPMLK
ncbi:uncharacterized protein LOC130711680 [Lotus japonicus]|uniref:uncharacterized protein LOC130711680 n=1 Tax=Lotus japonicus TaxID=34305 RepID=UPI00258E453F|nr:uncharacterized protein LOC130711680 [Lotus japonicus]